MTVRKDAPLMDNNDCLDLSNESWSFLDKLVYFENVSCKLSDKMLRSNLPWY